MASLDGRRILITGVSRGVGFETARLFLNEGAELIGVSQDAARLDRVARELDPSGKRLTVIAADVAEPKAPERIAASVEARWNGLDVLLNNAGVQIDGEAKGLVDGSEAVLARSLAVNLMAPYRLSLALLPLLCRGREPRIANVSSGAGTFAAMKERQLASYRLSKWALNGLTMLLASELAGIAAVNAFDPGWVKTDMGGRNAPGSPVESARGALSIVTLPWSETGKFWKDGQQIPF